MSLPLALILGILPALVWADPPGGGGSGSDGGGMRENPGDQIHIHSRSSENHKCPLCFERVYPEEATVGNLFGVSVCEEHGVLLHQKCAEEFGEGCPSCRGLTQRVESRSPGLLRQIHNDHVRDEAERMAELFVERMNERIGADELQRRWESAHDDLIRGTYLSNEDSFSPFTSHRAVFLPIIALGFAIVVGIPFKVELALSYTRLSSEVQTTLTLASLFASSWVAYQFTKLTLAGIDFLANAIFRSKLNRDFRNRVLAALERNHNIRLSHRQLRRFIKNPNTLPSSVSECLAREAAKQIDGMKE